MRLIVFVAMVSAGGYAFYWLRHSYLLDWEDDPVISWLLAIVVAMIAVGLAVLAYGAFSVLWSVAGAIT